MKRLVISVDSARVAVDSRSRSGMQLYPGCRSLLVIEPIGSLPRNCTVRLSRKTGQSKMVTSRPLHISSTARHCTAPWKWVSTIAEHESFWFASCSTPFEVRQFSYRTTLEVLRKLYQQTGHEAGICYGSFGRSSASLSHNSLRALLAPISISLVHKNSCFRPSNSNARPHFRASA